MSSVAKVTIHASQFPDAVRRDLIESLRARQVNHKFHYDSVKQTQKWLALHQAFSPSRTDTDCADTYNRSFEAAAKQMEGNEIHVIGLGCGGGQKDARLLKLLQQTGKKIYYTPSDVSTAMVLVAREAALDVIGDKDCHPFVCDLTSAADLRQVFASMPHGNIPRLYTFFGMIPNFEPRLILPRLGSLMWPQDHLLFSANLAPGKDYLAGIEKVLPLYDNDLTRDWLMTFLLDLGVEAGDGQLRFIIEDDPAGSGLKRIAAYFHFNRARKIAVEAEAFEFVDGDSIRLFFSYRHTPVRVRLLLGKRGFEVRDQWITRSEEEGVFLCRSTPDACLGFQMPPGT